MELGSLLLRHAGGGVESVVNGRGEQRNEVIVKEALERRGRRRSRRLGRWGNGGRGPRTVGGGGAAGTVRRAVDVDAVRAGGLGGASSLGSAGGLRSTVGGVELEHGGEADEVRRGRAGAAPRRERVESHEGRVHRRWKKGSP
jgi:hypothetical protein